MAITRRNYKVLQDFEAVAQFFIRNFKPNNADGNFYEAGWEYMHAHPTTPWDKLCRIGIWEEDGTIVGVGHVELDLGTVYLEVANGYEFLRPEMLTYCEEYFRHTNEKGEEFLCVGIPSFDTTFIEYMKNNGYTKAWEQEMMFMQLDREFPVELPEGYTISTLAEENDFYKIERVLYRGFEHGEEPPTDYLDERLVMQSAPHFSPELNIVIKAPNGDYAVYCGLWFDEVNKAAYLEPLCTDPVYRNLGLAKAALSEGMNRCRALGATSCTGGNKPFYHAIGFKEYYKREYWAKIW